MRPKRKDYLRINDGRITIGTYIDEKYRDRLDELAVKTGIARSRLCGNILNSFVELYDRYPEFLLLVASIDYDESINTLMLSLIDKNSKKAASDSDVE